MTQINHSFTARGIDPMSSNLTFSLSNQANNSSPIAINQRKLCIAIQVSTM